MNKFLVELFHSNSNNFPSQLEYAAGKEYKQNETFIYQDHPYNIKISNEINKSKIIPFHESNRTLICEHFNVNELLGILNESYQIINKGNSVKSKTPSAGGLYPIEMYVLSKKVNGLNNGIYHYNRNNGSLYYINSIDDPAIFTVPNNKFCLEAGALIIMVGRIENSLNKYGSRAYRYLLIECGHIGQNISIVCNQLGVRSCPIGGFYDKKLKMILNLNNDSIPLYLYAVGGK